MPRVLYGITQSGPKKHVKDTDPHGSIWCEISVALGNYRGKKKFFLLRFFVVDSVA